MIIVSRVTNGVRQGGIMSPVLFNIYMDDLSHTLNSSHIGCSINSNLVNHIMYADDTCLIAPSPSALQKIVNLCNDFAKDNFILFNEKKTFCMCFKPKSMSDLHIPVLSLNKVPLAFVSSCKYLGTMISDKCVDDDDIFRQVKSIYARGNMLISRFRTCSDDVKLKLFRSFLSNAYGSHLWTKYKFVTYRKVVVAYNDIFRKLFGIKRGESMSALYVRNNIDSVGAIIRKSCFNFITRITESDNILIQSIRASLFYFGSPIYDRWCKVLYTKQA